MFLSTCNVVALVVGSTTSVDFLPTALSIASMRSFWAVQTEKYSLLEQPSPNLCADRVDYALREFLDWANPIIVPFCVESLQAYERKMVFNSQKAASKFAISFLKCQTEHWGSAETVVRYYLLAKALKIGLQENIIVQQDLFEDDAFVLEKLQQSAHPPILQILSSLKGKIQYVSTDKDPDIATQKKFRYVDPEFMDNGKIIKLSDVDTSYASLIKEHQKRNQQGISIKLAATI